MPATERPDDAVTRNRDVNIRGVLVFGSSLALGTIFVGVAMWGLFRLLARQEGAGERPLPPAVASSLKRTPPEPRLEPNPLFPRARVRAEEDAALSSYGWVDEKTGTARIPITRAMEILVARGLPPAKPMTAPPAPMAGGKP
jgi:hypothetical protein